MIPAVRPLDVFDKFVDVDAEALILKTFVETVSVLSIPFWIPACPVTL
jgi:hypothetical protein